MANKKITDLQLIDAVTQGLSIPADDGIQTYRCTVAQIKEYLEQFLCPPGSVIYFGDVAPPTGYFLADGSSKVRADYPELFAVLGVKHGSADGTHFNLPDLRGIFVRGAGTHGTLQNANGSYFTGTEAAYQNDKMQGHKHGPTNLLPDSTGHVPSDLGGSFSIGTTPRSTDVPITDGSNGTPRTGTETNPANVALYAMIKF